ncbi:MAG: FtsQ-type POTRA domain-containing protein, partial [Myxococcota bacterium]
MMGVHHVLVKTTFFTVKEIQIQAASATVATQLSQILHTFQGRPFYGVSLQQIAEKAGEHPRVKTVWVQRSF